MAAVSAIPQAPPKDPEAMVAGEHTLPASWWTNEAIYELEKRAIFHRSWLFCIHLLRFTKAGDYFSFTVAGINFFIIKSKVDGQLRAFHNVCRHRAYPIVRKEQGSSTVLGCKYHGWSYTSDGKLNKAPHFDNVEGFVKEENSLYPIRTHVTAQGLVFVNFNNADTESFIEFDDWFAGLNTELSEFDFDDYEYHMSYELDGKFNWKTLMDGYQECYHCPTAHPGLNSAFKMETYKVVPKTRYCRHYAEIIRPEAPKQQAEEDGSWFGFGKKEKPPAPSKQTKANPGGEFNGLWVYLFPSNGINCYSPAWYSIRVLPQSAQHTILQYDIFTKKGLDEATKKEFVDFLQLVEIEDFNLCQNTQKNLDQGVYSSGYLHPQKEKGVLYYQGLVRDMVKEHFAKEQAAGTQIKPASVAYHKKNKDIEELEAICKTVNCGSEKEFDW
ncbi:ISP domain-containing protein [Suhomyces tanzawaensis NRRL Y-17324]|uniref:Choline monooxygenase, chloroplastic n=1 Tax=Suhomyces tanzawaensis NRRL Y-17324 TaxID=984487 RepID=A0A1E4SDV8_9ASCO|nr:ISP domain-containing protein [Suhomyces tanzawaensis NRRL Y-17324]ODV77699.1 ISP domain-containing protein [Suhomyces tanzawaensis NRRL Y-17324]